MDDEGRQRNRRIRGFNGALGKLDLSRQLKEEGEKPGLILRSGLLISQSLMDQSSLQSSLRGST